MNTYANRTPETIKAEMDAITDEKVLHLATFLQTWMTNEHNGRDFVAIATDKTIGSPALRAQVVIGHAYDWFAYGN